MLVEFLGGKKYARCKVNEQPTYIVRRELQELETEEEVESTSKLIGLPDPLCIRHGLFTLSIVLSSDRELTNVL
jgi:hypothetical protein